MKNLIYLISVFLIVSCNSSPTMEIAGTIENGLKGEEVILSVPYLNTMDTICFVNHEGHFTAEFPLEKPHLGFLRIGDLALQIHCKPKAKLEVDIDYKQVKEGDLNGIILSGKGYEGSELLKKMNTIRHKIRIRQLLALSQDEFMSEIEHQTDSIEDLILSYQDKHPRDLLLIEQARLLKQVEHATDCNNYAMYHKQLVPTDTQTISDKIVNYSDQVPLDDYNSIRENPSYKRFVTNEAYHSIVDFLKTKAYKGDSKEYFEAFFDKVKEKETVQDIKDEIVHDITLEYTYLSEGSKSVIRKRYRECEKNEGYIKEFENTLATLTKIEPGQPSPKFAFKNLKNTVVTLDDLKGKYIYIDVWASWCGPCKSEIPHLKALEKEFKKEDIEFVSISVDNKEEDWRKMVKEKNLKGIQLFADKAWGSDFVKQYAINGIPRFILLDKDGNIIDSNTTRPSNPETKETLKALLEK